MVSCKSTPPPPLNCFSTDTLTPTVSCEVCNDTVKKPKLDAHKGRCQGAYFTCIDCSTTFQGGDYRSHTVCFSSSSSSPI